VPYHPKLTQVQWTGNASEEKIQTSAAGKTAAVAVIEPSDDEKVTNAEDRQRD
jgi:hypothetical protein